MAKREKIRGPVHHDINNLRKLNAKGYYFIPQECRPLQSVEEHKKFTMKIIEEKYHSLADYIRNSVFKIKGEERDGKIVVPAEKVPKDITVFRPNMFPYEVPQGSNHYVLWYSKDKVDDDTIRKDIQQGIQKCTSSDNFDFVFYRNPKMTIPAVFHVQVFWGLTE